MVRMIVITVDCWCWKWVEDDYEQKWGRNLEGECSRGRCLGSKWIRHQTGSDNLMICSYLKFDYYSVCCIVAIIWVAITIELLLLKLLMFWEYCVTSLSFAGTQICHQLMFVFSLFVKMFTDRICWYLFNTTI